MSQELAKLRARVRVQEHACEQLEAEVARLKSEARSAEGELYTERLHLRELQKELEELERVG